VRDVFSFVVARGKTTRKGTTREMEEEGKGGERKRERKSNRRGEYGQSILLHVWKCHNKTLKLHNFTYATKKYDLSFLSGQ
jgi:hypothetical protein